MDDGRSLPDNPSVSLHPPRPLYNPNKSKPAESPGSDHPPIAPNYRMIPDKPAVQIALNRWSIHGVSCVSLSKFFPSFMAVKRLCSTINCRKLLIFTQYCTK